MSHQLAFADCLACRAVYELLACRELGMRCGTQDALTTPLPIQDPSIKFRLCWTSCLQERVETSIHSPSHRQKVIGPHFPSEKAPPTASNQIICLQTDTIIQRTKGRKKHQCCPQIYLEFPCLHRVPLTQRQIGVG